MKDPAISKRTGVFRGRVCRYFQIFVLEKVKTNNTQTEFQIKYCVNKSFTVKKGIEIMTKTPNFHSSHMSEAVARMCSVRNMFIKISRNWRENTCARVSFFNKVAGLQSFLLALYLENSSLLVDSFDPRYLTLWKEKLWKCHGWYPVHCLVWTHDLFSDWIDCSN